MYPAVCRPQWYQEIRTWSVNVYAYNQGMPRAVQIKLARITAASTQVKALIWYEVQSGVFAANDDWKLQGGDVLCCLLHYR